ncbi:hypothetical protein K474DRAFT_1708932 [Panus rudis PR-1116 ss-1]|nr:hypothetical protein K474DRAFT_1708932 [Panus rudis PR-1116 ss-1]
MRFSAALHATALVCAITTTAFAIPFLSDTQPISPRGVAPSANLEERFLLATDSWQHVNFKRGRELYSRKKENKGQVQPEQGQASRQVYEPQHPADGTMAPPSSPVDRPGTLPAPSQNSGSSNRLNGNTRSTQARHGTTVISPGNDPRRPGTSRPVTNGHGLSGFHYTDGLWVDASRNGIWFNGRDDIRLQNGNGGTLPSNGQQVNGNGGRQLNGNGGHPPNGNGGRRLNENGGRQLNGNSGTPPYNDGEMNGRSNGLINGNSGHQLNGNGGTPP